jgi:DNA mismatch repair protein PMS2
LIRSAEIRVRESGAGGVEVQDNGSGVAPEDYAGLTKRYATSKIREFDDVAKV